MSQQVTVALFAILGVVALCLSLHDKALMGAYRFKKLPLWEVGFAFQPGRWAFCLMVSFYGVDRGIAVYLGPFYAYIFLGAKPQ